MRLLGSEKLEIIRLVEQSHLPGRSHEVFDGIGATRLLGLQSPGDRAEVALLQMQQP